MNFTRFCVYGGLTAIIILSSMLLGNIFESNLENECEKGNGYSLMGHKFNQFPINYTFGPNVTPLIIEETTISFEIWDDLVSFNLFERNDIDYKILVEYKPFTDYPVDEKTIAGADISSNRTDAYEYRVGVNATIIFNDYYEFNIIPFSCDMKSVEELIEVYDIRSVALHEIGHVLGLDHHPLYELTMNYSYQGSFQKTLAQGDIDGFLELYGGFENE